MERKKKKKSVQWSRAIMFTKTSFSRKALRGYSWEGPALVGEGKEMWDWKEM